MKLSDIPHHIIPLNSSNVAGADFVPGVGMLVKFHGNKKKDGTVTPPRTYLLPGASVKQFGGLLAADSHGKFFAQHLRSLEATALEV